MVEDLIAEEEELTEWNLKNIHALILKEIDNRNAGRYRDENVLISAAKHIPPKHFELNYLMQKLVKEYNQGWKTFHPVVRATLLHGELERVWDCVYQRM